MQVEPDESGAPRGLLPALGVVLLLVGVVLASVFIFRLQTPYVPPTETTTPAAGVASIVMPAGVGADQTLNFSPSNAIVVIGVNNTVVWTNEDSAAHTVVSVSVPAGAQAFKSGVLSKGDTFKVTLNATGTYTYFCSIHPAWMKATIVVKSGGAATKGAVVKIPNGSGSGANFDPASITVVIGVNSTVTWINNDVVAHTVLANDKSFQSPIIQPGGTYIHEFTTPGTYSYYCSIHPAWMKGTVIVKAGG